jgi:orotidine-5'-phosphate decarboxylase
MSSRNFRALLEAQWGQGKFLCIGLDPDLRKIPARFISESGDMGPGNIISTFNHLIVEATRDLAAVYKPNVAFYEALGKEGLWALDMTISHIRAVAPQVPVILDAKRADIGHTNLGYVQMAFDLLGADAITVHPYLGREALQPFLNCSDKGVIVLCRTSNPGAGEFQDPHLHLTEEECQALFYSEVTGELTRDIPNDPTTMPFYQYVAHRVANHWNMNGNCAVVVGATYPDELQEVRGIVGDLPILVPGVGFQQKNIPLEEQVRQVVAAGMNSCQTGLIINSSRGILYASEEQDFVQAARRETERLHNLIKQYL